MPAHRGNRSPKPKHILTSIIVPCWNQLEFTRICLDSLFERTGSHWELIVIDNGSTDGTAAYLANIRKKPPVPVTVITNQANRGFPAAINQGLQAAKGEYLVLLNNDTVVTDGWLDRLIAVAKLKPSQPPIGMVGPMSNYVSPPQMVEAVSYQTLHALPGFASQWRDEHRGKWFPAPKLSGFCLLMTRSLYQAVGGLDERFGLGMFDDDDLALRARKAGFGLVVAQDVFIHHFGGRTFAGQGIDANALLDQNMTRFRDKWGAEAPPMSRVNLPPSWSASRQGNGAGTDRKRTDRVIDAIIFHQEFEMLDFRLKLLYPHVDKVVIVEADKTFSGLDKPFYYEQHKKRYAWASDKIFHYKLHCDISKLKLATPPTQYQPDHDSWQIEYAQRGAMVAACKDFPDDDLLMMSDVDEIPSLEALAWAKQNVGQLPAVCQQHFFYYDLRHLRQEVLLGSIFSTLRTARSRGAQDLRNHRNSLTRLANAGWHLSYFTDADAIIKKIESFSHQELNVPEFKNKKHIDRCRTGGADLFNRGTTTTRVLPDFFPPYFRDAVPAHWWGADQRASEKSPKAKGTKAGKRATVSLTMIVRNEEKNLPRCLESVRGLFDQIVVVDTGSTDRTKKIAASFGARVVDFAWIDDFAAARNVALDHATGDYAFWLDADDVIEPPERKKLETLLKDLRKGSQEAYVLRCFSTMADGGDLAVDHPRLFPRLPGIRWERRVHEVINSALDRAGTPIVWTDIIIRHGGYADPAVHERKRQRTLALLHKELAERPDDPFIYYYLGTLSFERGRWQEALGNFILGLAKWGTTQSIACKLFAMIAWTNQKLDLYGESLRVSDEGLTHFPDSGELLFRKAIALRYLHRPSEAEACFNRILGLGRPNTLYSVEPGIFGYKTRGNLAIIAQERGDYPIARAHWQEVLGERPGYPEALRRLAEMAGKMQSAGAEA
jgi:glycosyltransferase involved in cell wall biosynthesis